MSLENNIKTLEASITELTLTIKTLIDMAEADNAEYRTKTNRAEAEDTTQAPAQPTPIEEIKEVAVQLVTKVATEQSYEDIREAIKGRCKTLMEKNRDNKAKIMVEFNKFNATHVSKVSDKNLEPLLKLLMEIK
jgi:prefoldin subunit 5